MLPSAFSEDKSLVPVFKAVFWEYIITPIIWINWDREPSGYAENLDNWIFL
jgi:hypothetical protein